MESKNMEENVTEILARFAATVNYEEIPERVRDFAKLLLLDTLACALAGHQGEETHQIESLASGLAQSAESSIIGGTRLSLAGATLLNAFLIAAVTMNDVHLATLTHVTPELMPAALAVAERDSSSGRDLLVSLIVGCETTTRIGVGLDFTAFRRRGFHGPGVIGPFGAAAAVGRLLGFGVGTMAAAFGLAGSQAAGTFAALGTPTVKFHQCRGALSGLMAALLAQQGFIATREFLTAADGGLFNSYSNGGCPEAVVEGLGNRWELEQISLRLWPAASSIQGVATAVFDLVEMHGITPDQIQHIDIYLSQTTFERYGTYYEPEGKFRAMASPHYATAVILHDRELSLAQYLPERYSDPKLIQFASSKVEAKPDSALTGAQARIEAETTNGSIITVQCPLPKGAPENPLSRSEVESKFRTYAKTRLPESRIEEVIGIVTCLEELASTGKLMDTLRRA